MVPSAVMLGRISHGVGCNEVQSGMTGYSAWPVVSGVSCARDAGPYTTIYWQCRGCMHFQTGIRQADHQRQSPHGPADKQGPTRGAWGDAEATSITCRRNDQHGPHQNAQPRRRGACGMPMHHATLPADALQRIDSAWRWLPSSCPAWRQRFRHALSVPLHAKQANPALK